MPQTKINKKKILIINYEFPPIGGGGGVATYDLAVEWAKNNHVDVITSHYEGLSRVENMMGINVYRTKVLSRNSRDTASFVSMLTYNITGFFTGIKLCRKNKYDVINTHFAVPSGPLGYVLGKFFKIPNLLFIHGGDIYDPSKKMSPHKSPIFRRVVRFILNHADRIVCQSSNTKNNAIKYYGTKKDIIIIPLPFHVPAVKTAKRKDLGLSDKDFIITSIGRLVKRKDYPTAIKAIAATKDKKIKLVIIGDGPEKEPLQKLASDLGISEKIIFAGFCAEEQKYKYLKSSDLFMMTSLHEGFGIVFMEAMYCSLPIVCTNNGGQVDFLKHEENALLVNVGDINACALSIERFMKDKKLHQKCSTKNRNDVKKFYAENIASEFEKIFIELSGCK